MLFPNRHLLTPGIGFAIVLSLVAHAQIAAPPGDKKSDEIGTLLDGEAYMFGKDMQLHKSNVKMTVGQHQAALKKGARELRPRIVGSPSATTSIVRSVEPTSSSPSATTLSKSRPF